MFSENQLLAAQTNACKMNTKNKNWEISLETQLT